MYRLILLFIALSSFSFGQEIEVKWSEKMHYDNKADGFFEEFVGGNSKYIFAKYNNLTVRKRKPVLSKFKLIAYDKKTMKKKTEASIIDFKKKPAQKDKFKDMVYDRTIVFENVVYVFWLKQVKNKQELYAQTFDGNLAPLNPLKKVYELSWPKGSDKKSSLFVIGNRNSNEKILIGGELPAEKGESIRFEYKLLNKDFGFEAANQITLPVKITGRNNSDLSSSYTLEDDGMLYVKTAVEMTKDEKKDAKKGEARVYYVFSAVNPMTGVIKSYPIKFENKNIYGYKFETAGNVVKLYGFFTDLIKDPRGNDTHGIFYGTMDNKNFELVSSNFSYFTKEQLDNLFAGDLKDRSDKKALKTKKKKKSEDESIASNYEIEDIQSIDKDNLVLFCSRMNNYSVTTCDSKGNCTTRYYCEKRNVTVFKVNDKGAIVWASNIDRKKTYSGWWVYDVQAVNNNGKFYVIYGSDYHTKAEKQNNRSKKKKSYSRDVMEYAVIDYAKGSFSKEEYRINDLKAKKSERKTVNPAAVYVIDNQFYTASSRKRMKTHAIVLGCLGSLVCPPVFLIAYANPGAYKGDGYVGTIRPLK